MSVRQAHTRDRGLSAMLLAAVLQPGHLHGTAGVTIGPLALRLLLVAAVLVVAAFALLDAFTPRPDHGTAVGLWSAAATVVVIELLLSGGLDMPPHAVPPVLAVTAAPAYAIFSRTPRWAALRGALRAAAPWVSLTIAVLAAIEFGRAWFTATGEQQTTLLHTGVQLAGVAMSWFVISLPSTRPAIVLPRTTVAVVATLAVAATAVTISSAALGS